MGAFERKTPEEMKEIVRAILIGSNDDRLGSILAAAQSDYAYDPCGKSWDELNYHLTPVGAAVVKRFAKLYNGEDLRG